jgi:hypothetical protein
MPVTRQWNYFSSRGTGNIAMAIPDALTAGDVYVALDLGNYSTTSQHGTALSGLGVSSWTRITAAQTNASEAWVGLGASSLPANEPITLTAPTLTGGTTSRTLVVYCFRGVSTSTAVQIATGTSTTVTTASSSVGAGQVAIAYGYSAVSADSLKNLVPGSGWATTTFLTLHSTDRFAGYSHRIPSSTESHTAQASRVSGFTQATVLTLGDLDSPLTSTFVGWGNPIL